jgi:hypothetical protein
MNSGGGFFNLRFPSLEVTSRPEIVTFIIYVISYMLLMVVCQESVIRESGIRPEISPPKERLRGLAPNHEIGNIRSLIHEFLVAEFLILLAEFLRYIIYVAVK